MFYSVYHKIKQTSPTINVIIQEVDYLKEMDGKVCQNIYQH